MASPAPIPGLEFKPERWDPVSARDRERREILTAISGLAEQGRRAETGSKRKAPKPPEMREDTNLDRFGRRLRDIPRGLQSGLAGAASSLDTTAANAAMLARFLGMWPEESGPEPFLRARAAELAATSRNLSRGEDAGAIEKVSQVLGGLPIALPEAVVAVETGGVIPGLTGLAALSAADQGPAAAGKAAAEALPMALLFKGLHAAPPAARAPIITGGTALLSQEEDPVKRATEALAMGGTSLITPRAPKATPAPAAPAAVPLVTGLRAKLGLPEQPGAHHAPVRIEGRSEPLAAQYELRELDQVQASNDPLTMAKNPRYGGQQQRDYVGSTIEQMKVIQGADHFDTREVLSDAPNAVTGPPIVDAEGNVWAGNGRAMMYGRVYSGHAKTAPETVRAAVIESAPKFGLDPAQAAAMKRPIIVRQLAPEEVPKTATEGLALSGELNIGVTTETDIRALAQSKAAALDKGLTAFSEAVHAAPDDAPTIRKVFESGPAARAFSEALQADGIIPPIERARWLTEDGLLNKQGVDLAEEMLLARVIPDKATVDATPAALRDKVLRSVPAIMQIESLAPGSLTPLIVDVVHSEIARAAVPGKTPTVDEFNGQQLLGITESAPSQRDPRVAALQKLIAEGKPMEVSKRLGALRARVEDAVGGQLDLGTGRVPTLEEAFAETLGVKTLTPAEQPRSAAAAAEPSRVQPETLPTEPPARPAPPPAPGGAPAPPPEPPRAPLPAPPPPEPPASAGRAAPPPPRRRPPTSSAEFYERLAEKRGAELRRARGLADEAATDAAAPFRQATGTPLDRPAALRQEEVSALLRELLARKQGGTPEQAVDELLSRNDFNTLEHADVLLPSIARFYAAHAEVARRGVVKDTVLRELAAQQGLTEEQVVRRMVGETPNAETLLAMKDIVQRKLDRVNDLLDKLADPEMASPRLELELATEHKVLGLLWAQLRGATAEVGRALRATRLKADRDRARGGRLTLEDLQEIYDASHGGADNVKLLLEQLQNLRHTPEQLRAHLRKTYTATRWDQFMFAYRAVLLSGLRTLARNFLGNMQLMLTAPVSREVGGVAGKALELLPIRRIRIPMPGMKTDLVNIAIRERAEGVPQSRLGEGAATAFGMIGSGRAAARLYWDTVFGPAPEGAGIVGRAFSLPGRFLFNEEVSEAARNTERTGTPIEGKLGQAIAVPFRQLEAWDVAFRHPHRVGELTAIAYREAGKNGLRTPAEVLEFVREFTLDPPEWAWKQADAFAKELTLTEPLGSKGRAFQNFVNHNPGFQFLMPFTRVPLNLWKMVGRHSPLALMMSDVRVQLERGGAERDRAIGRILVGSSLLTYAAVLARQGLITGAGPSDRDQRRLKKETGWRPYSIKIGGEYYSIRGAEPLSTQLGIVADLVEAGDNLSEETSATILSQLGISSVRNMADQSMMAGLAGVLESVALQDPESLDRFFSRSTAGLLVPRGLEGPISAVKEIGGALAGAPDERPWRADPYLRESRGLMDDVLIRLGMGEAELKEFGRDRLPPRTGFWAQPLEKPNIVGPDWISPFTSSKENTDPVTGELYRLVVARKNGLPGLPAYENPPDSIGQVELTPRQHWEYKYRARHNAKLELDRIVAGGAWKAIDKIPDAGVRDTVKAQLFDGVITGWQAVARAEMLGSFNDADRIKATMDDKTNRLLRAQGRIAP